MRKKANLLIVLILCGLLILTACAPKVVDEVEAKEAGLALINLAFRVKETEAEVKYFERAGESYKNGAVVQYGTEEPRRLYTVIVPTEDGDLLYYAEVNAVTGVAYRVQRNLSTIHLTQEQSAEAASLGTLNSFSTANFSEKAQDAARVAEEWVSERLESDVPILRTIPNNTFTDSEDFPLVRMDSYVLLENGTIDLVTVCWPSMDVVELALLNQGK
ncbi:hypothetical protein SDC9_143322 [bioreactor metagenome]|uniref:Uncharacterized protein n=1 Tax=bioreactor metagenome TaxID=1076179 RepID=A0A645E3S2_9ZZZZ